jgi:hypothetical protein
MKKLIYMDLNYHYDLSNVPRDIVSYIDVFKNLEGAMDRTLYTKFPINYAVNHPIPKFDGNNIPTYADACNERATTLIKQAEDKDKKIYLMWSGGVDSTAILVSFLINSTAEQRQRFVVLMSQDSIRENPEFFKNHILNKLEYQTSSRLIDMYYTDSNLFVHGEVNGQLYGENIINWVWPKMTDADETLITVESMLTVLNTLNKKYIAMFIFIMKSSAQSIGVDLVTLRQYSYWYNLNFRMPTNNTRPLRYYSDINQTHNRMTSNIRCFYSSLLFDRWAINRMIYIKENKTSIYRKATKDYIFAFDKNQQYYDKMSKINSGSKITSNYQEHRLLNLDLKGVDISEINDYYNPDNVFRNFK